ncbi:unnamed protein product, partial [marine sediment metagenome]
YVHWGFAICFTGAFLLYEFNQDMHLKDGAYLDIKGFLYGLAIGGIVIFITSCF